MEEEEIIPLIKEVSLLKACKHPNIIHFLGAWKDEEYLYVFFSKLFIFKIEFYIFQIK